MLTKTTTVFKSLASFWFEISDSIIYLFFFLLNTQSIHYKKESKITLIIWRFWYAIVVTNGIKYLKKLKNCKTFNMAKSQMKKFVKTVPI